MVWNVYDMLAKPFKTLEVLSIEALEVVEAVSCSSSMASALKPSFLGRMFKLKPLDPNKIAHLDTFGVWLGMFCIHCERCMGA